MALTQLKTGAIADDAVTGAKIADDTVAEANIANDAIGLTELKAGTDGQIITYDASGNPTAVGPGTDGQVLTSTGAGSPPAFEALPASTTINNNADNRVITGSGTANTLEGEANLTFSSDVLQVSSTTQGLGAKYINTGNEYTNLQFSAARTGASQALGIINAKWNNNHEVAAIYLTAGDDTSNKDDGHIKFYTAAASGSIAERLHIRNNGNVSVTDGNLVFDTAGHGIDFSAQTGTGSGTGQANESELLNHYEEGKLDPTASSANLTFITSTEKHLHYIRIGKLVTVSGLLEVDAVTSNSTVVQVNMPFTAAPNSDGFYARGVGAVMPQQVNIPGSANYITSYVGGNENYMRFFYAATDSDFHQLENSDLNNNSTIYFNITYAIS